MYRAIDRNRTLGIVYKHHTKVWAFMHRDRKSVSLFDRRMTLEHIKHYLQWHYDIEHVSFKRAHRQYLVDKEWPIR